MNAYHDILTLKREEFFSREARKRRREQISIFLSERNNKLKSERPSLSHSPSSETAPTFPPSHGSLPQTDLPAVPIHHLISSPHWELAIEDQLLHLLCSWNPDKPQISSVHLCAVVRKCTPHKSLSHITLLHILDKLSFSGLISVNAKCPPIRAAASLSREDMPVYDLSYVDVYKVKAYLEEGENQPTQPHNIDALSEEDLSALIEDMLQASTYRERENKRVGDEIKDLLERPTVKERYIQEKFRTQGGSKLRTFCPSGTKEDCRKARGSEAACKRLHFKKLINQHTDEALGDCSFLNTCFHMDTCKFVHYMIDESVDEPDQQSDPEAAGKGPPDPQLREGPEDPSRCLVVADSAGRYERMLYPPQFVKCDLRFFNFSVLGKFDIVMADPPWDIHMELPYGTLSDDEMKALDIPSLQTDGYMFLWVTGRAMELGRECLSLWGYRRVDEIIWVKTNQLQRLIRTGRTGHWLNHGKEHCLVGLKGNPTRINRGLDCDVIVAEVRETSHKPDEIYGILERLAPGTLKCELFGRQHNCQRNWITLGNQLDGVKILDPLIYHKFYQYYPDGNANSKMPRSIM